MVTAEKIEKARSEGYSDDEIVGFLEVGKDADIANKVKTARKEGYAPNEIVRYLLTGKSYIRMGQGRAALSGAFKGPLTVAGFPVDAITAGLKEVGRASVEGPLENVIGPLQYIEKPIGGSEHLMSLAAKFPGVRDYGSIENLAPEERPIAAAAEVMGAGIPFVVGPLAAPGLFGQIGVTAQTNPLGFAAKEIISLFGAAQGAALSRMIAPESGWAQLGGEVVGGVASPTSLVGKAVGPVYRQGAKALKKFTRAGRETVASKWLNQALESTGEDRDTVVKALEQQSLTRTTSGIKSGSPTLIAIEKKLAKETPAFSREVTETADEAITSLRVMTDELRRTGNPAALKVAAEVERQKFQEIIAGRLRTAEGKVDALYASVPKDKAQTISKNAAGILDSAVSDLRQYEKALWEQVPKTVTAPPTNTLEAYDALQKTLLRGETIDPVIERFVREHRPQRRPDGAIITPKAQGWQLQRLKSIAGSAAAQARTKGDNDLARQYTMIEAAARADLDGFIGDAADRARAFTRQFHDTVTRTYAGESMALKETGAQRTPDELLLDRAFGTGGDAADLRFKQLGEAANLGASFGLPGMGRPMLNEQEKFLTQAAMSLRGADGRITPDRLGRFLQDNAAIMERFPGLKQQLSSIESAERTLADVQGSVRQASRAILEKSAFSRVLGVEDPSIAVEKALRSDNPTRDFNRILKFASKGGPEARNGLKVSVMDYAERAAIKNGNFQFSAYEDALFGANLKGGLSPVELMKRHGVIARGEEVRLRQIIREGKKIQDALSSKTAIDVVGEDTDALFDVVVRLVGAEVATKGVMGRLGGHPLLLANVGSQYARRVFEKVPITRTKEVLMEAARNPEFMAALLKKTSSIPEQKQIARQIHAFLWQAGLTSEPEIEFQDIDWGKVKEFAKPKPFSQVPPIFTPQRMQ